MESNWRWNGWAGGFWTPQTDMAARLLVPIFGYEWLIRPTADGVAGLQLAFLDTDLGWYPRIAAPVISGDTFPYGYAVTQFRLP